MDNKEFKTMFGEVAKKNGFSKTVGGWYKEFTECLATLALQKSNFGNYYLLRINIYIQGAFGRTYSPADKELMKRSLGFVSSSETKESVDVFSIDTSMDDNLRQERLEELFKNHIVPFTNKTSTRAGIKEMAMNGEIKLLPAVEKELEYKS